MDCFAWCVVCAHPHVCAPCRRRVCHRVSFTRPRPAMAHAPRGARARVWYVEVEQHNVTPPPCRPKLPVYEHQLNLKLVTSTSVKSLKNPVKMHRRARRLDPYSPAHARFIPLTGCTRVLCRAGSSSPGIPDDNNEARTLCERRQRSRAAGSQQSSRARPALPTQSSTEGFHLTLPYLTSKEKKRRKKNRTTSELHSHVMSNENKFPSKNTRVPTKLQFMYYISK